MSFKTWLEDDERGGTKMRIPDGRPTGQKSGRAGQSQATPEGPAKPSLTNPPPSTMTPGTKMPNGAVPSGSFGGGTKGKRPDEWPLKPSSFGGPLPPPNFTPQPSNFVTGKNATGFPK